MSWLTNFIRPKIRSFVGQKDVPDNLWQKCPSCDGMLFNRDLKENLNVCYHCDFHMTLPLEDRFQILFDGGIYKNIPAPKVPEDPLKFKDKKRYADRLRDTRHKTKENDAIRLVKGTVGGQPLVIAAFNFSFMGGSMGAAVGEGIVKAAEVAVKEKAALLVIPASGGARMQEGMLSLMQMPRSIIAVNMVKDAGLPYIVLLVNPTTGGVSASFAMVGDLHLAEPGATIGFAGKRVIEETIREQLPDDFQTAEYLLEHGMVDMVVSRKDSYETLARILNLLMNHKTSGDGKKKTTRKTAPKKNSKAKKVKAAAKAAGQVAQLKTMTLEEDSLAEPANTNNGRATKKKKTAQTSQA